MKTYPGALAVLELPHGAAQAWARRGPAETHLTSEKGDLPERGPDDTIPATVARVYGDHGPTLVGTEHVIFTPPCGGPR